MKTDIPKRSFTSVKTRTSNSRPSFSVSYFAEGVVISSKRKTNIFFITAVNDLSDYDRLVFPVRSTYLPCTVVVQLSIDLFPANASRTFAAAHYVRHRRLLRNISNRRNRQPTRRIRGPSIIRRTIKTPRGSGRYFSRIRWAYALFSR